MKTRHIFYFSNSNNMIQVQSKSIDLVVTSPPYPMIEMWDEVFIKQNPEIKKALTDQNGRLAFELMHQELDKVWNELFRVLKQGTIACINIGDATRKIGKDFQLYPNHSRIIAHCLELGFEVLPCIIWRKPTNAPNKFMGSGMLPPGAYVTLEHEYILILRKGGIRNFNIEEGKIIRRRSAFFWEERNKWFSDIWFDVKGVKQIIRKNKEMRARSAAYPLELAYRLVNMFSVQEDLVLDPFVGTGTTALAAMIAARNSVGFEIDPSFEQLIAENISGVTKLAIAMISQRLINHETFIKERTEAKGAPKYINERYKFPVMTRQEIQLYFPEIKALQVLNNCNFEVEYSD
ncbi:MAG: DNA-methyltransferase [Candidatus Hodarchaeales archaeon]